MKIINKIPREADKFKALCFSRTSLARLPSLVVTIETFVLSIIPATTDKLIRRRAIAKVIAKPESVKSPMEITGSDNVVAVRLARRARR